MVFHTQNICANREAVIDSTSFATSKDYRLSLHKTANDSYEFPKCKYATQNSNTQVTTKWKNHK